MNLLDIAPTLCKFSDIERDAHRNDVSPRRELPDIKQ